MLELGKDKTRQDETRSNRIDLPDDHLCRSDEMSDRFIIYPWPVGEVKKGKWLERKERD